MRGTLTFEETQERSREHARQMQHVMNLEGIPLVEWVGTMCRPLSYAERVALWVEARER
jgi:hypothetical protein